jgi:hypothetical protein
MDPSSYLTKRVSIEGNRATIKYAGPLLHPVTGQLALKKDDLWFGIEWDNTSRGKHNGTVSGTTYFTAGADGNPCSLVLEKKCDMGVDILEGIVRRYFKDEEAKEILTHKENIVEVLSAKAKELESLDTKDIKTEFDEDAFIYTHGIKTKQIHMMGFDKHWKRINMLDKTLELGINESLVSDFGPIGNLKPLIRMVTNLSLENNLLCNWEQVVQLGIELPQLEQLNLSYNKLLIPAGFEKMTKFRTLNAKSEEIECQDVKKIFPYLKMLVLLEMGLTWQKLQCLSYFFPALENLVRNSIFFLILMGNSCFVIMSAMILRISTRRF